MNEPNKSIRSVVYTLETSKWIDFSKPLNPQISKINSTVQGPNKGLQALNENRSTILREVETFDKGRPKYNYKISASMDFPANSFLDANKPLSFRHVTSIRVQALHGTDTYVNMEANNINAALNLLNNFLKEAKPTKKIETSAWATKLNTVITELNNLCSAIQETKHLRREEIDEALKLTSNSNKSLWKSVLPGKGTYKYLSAAMICATYAIGINQLMKNFGFFHAGLLYILDGSFESILTSLLSNENLLPSSRDAIVQQYLQAAELRPEVLNARALFNDVSINSQSIFLFGSLLSMTLMTMWLMCRIICRCRG